MGTRKWLVKSQRGVALMIAMFTIVLITYLVNELVYETSVEFLVNSRAVNRIKAYYAARSGLELSLLRIKIYAQVQKQLGKNAAGQSKLLDLVWQFPFSWPIVVPPEADAANKSSINDALKESQMDASYATTISDEGSKIDLNDLASASTKIADLTKQNMSNIMLELQKNEEFMKTHPNFRPDEIIGNITDWVTLDNTSKTRGNKADLYSQINNDVVQLPPNRGFRTVDELRLVGGLDDEIFNYIKDRVTVFGSKAINPNHASAEVIMSLDPSITKDVAAAVLTRRDSDEQGGPFKDGTDNCKGDFWSFVNSKGARVSTETENSIPLKCDSVMNFRIKSVGEFNGVTREITAVVYDLNYAAQAVANAVKSEQSSANSSQASSSGASSPSGSSPTTGAQSQPLPKGPPRIVYFNER